MARIARAFFFAISFARKKNVLIRGWQGRVGTRHFSVHNGFVWTQIASKAFRMHFFFSPNSFSWNLGQFFYTYIYFLNLSWNSVSAKLPQKIFAFIFFLFHFFSLFSWNLGFFFFRLVFWNLVSGSMADFRFCSGPSLNKI